MPLDHRELRSLLRSWFETQVCNAPADDPRRTPACLSVAEVVSLAQGQLPTTQEQQQHQDSCQWCRKALAVAQRLVDQEARAARVRDSAPDAQWPETLRQRLATEPIDN